MTYLFTDLYQGIIIRNPKKERLFGVQGRASIDFEVQGLRFGWLRVSGGWSQGRRLATDGE